MLISELSEKSGLSKHTIRFYEKLGLISAKERQAGTRIYKEYSHETLEHLVLITQGKKLGFTLSEIKSFIQELNQKGITKERKIEIIQIKLLDVKEKIQQLQETENYLKNKLKKIQSGKY